MASPTNCYCDYAAGNDYKGTSFTDGAWTASTHTLAKTGAFAATKVNHWLYLEPNGGASFTAGYFKVATIPDANSVTLATDPSAGDLTDVKCTQHDGTTTLPWRSVQGALDLITRDSTNGNQVNVKAGTAQVNQAALTLTTYGTPAESAPLIIRGYTTAAGDGGIGEIDCNGLTMLAASTYSHLHLVELEIHNGGNTHLINLDSATGPSVIKCEIHKGASTPSSKALVYISGGLIVGCHIHDAGTGGIGIDTPDLAYGNYVANCETGIRRARVSANNVFVDCATAAINLSDRNMAVGNSIYSSTAATGSGILAASGAMPFAILNNVIQGYSGTGGDGISITSDMVLLGYNAFYNNTANETLADTFVDLGGDATPASSPFTNAGSGDFSLNTAVAGAIEAAWPGAWPGLATTMNKQDMGAVQKGAGAGTTDTLEVRAGIG